MTKKNTKLLTCCIPALICILLLATYLISPSFYLQRILEEHSRESGVVEIVTWVSALLGALLLLCAAWKLHIPRAKLHHQTAALFILTVGLAAFFLGGEEVSWGQTWFGWGTPESYDSVETNIHNNQVLKRMGINVNSLGSLFLIIVFILLPIVSKKWKQKPAFAKPMERVMPGALAISFVVTGFIWKEIKSLYRAFTTDAQQDASVFYMQFLEQINEQKEMFMALGLLAFGIQIVKSAQTNHADHENIV